MLPTSDTVPGSLSAGVGAVAPANSPFILIDFIEAAEALARRFLLARTERPTYAQTLICAECMRGTVGDELLHAESCGVGAVLRLAKAGRAHQLRTAMAAARQILVDVDACGDSFFDPVTDGQFWCSLPLEHEGDHFDEVRDYQWRRDEDRIGAIQVSSEIRSLDRLSEEVAKISRFDGPVGTELTR